MIFKSSLISAKELAESLTNNDIFLLDCTIDKVGKSLQDEKLELIPNTQFFDIEGKLSDKYSNLPHTLVSPENFEKEMQTLGINQDSIVVLYDRWGIYSSPRAWWMFKVMGFDNAFVLNGGMPNWKENNYPICNSYCTTIAKGNFTSNFREHWYADKEYILTHYKSNTIDIYDARSSGRFAGTSPEPRKGLIGGHIPNSINISFDELLTDQIYLEKEEIKRIFKSFNKPSQEHIFTCGSGVTASILAFASHLLDTEKIRVYDGSWAEWGNSELNLPIEK